MKTATSSRFIPVFILALLALCFAARAQTDAFIKARPDFQNQLYLAAPTNAPGTSLAQPAAVTLISGSVGDATSATNPAPNDGLVFLAQVAVGQWIGEKTVPSSLVVTQGANFQQAIDSAAPGDMLVVQSGTYGGNLSFTKPLTVVSADTNRVQFTGNVTAGSGGTNLFVRVQFAGLLTSSNGTTLVLSQSACSSAAQILGGTFRATESQLAGLTATGGLVTLARCTSSGNISLTGTAFQAFRLNTTGHIFGAAPTNSGTPLTIAQSVLQVVHLTGYRATLGYNSLFGDARTIPRLPGNYPAVIYSNGGELWMVGNIAHLYAIKAGEGSVVLIAGGTLQAHNNRLVTGGDNFDQQSVYTYGLLLSPGGGEIINNSIGTYITQAYNIGDQEVGILNQLSGGNLAVRNNVVQTLRFNDPSSRITTIGVGQYLNASISECAYNCISVSTGPALDGVTGTNNVLADPLTTGGGSSFFGFDGTLSPSNPWFSLQPNSPCINAGSPGLASNDTDGTRNDIGYSGGPFWNSANYTNDVPLLLALTPGLAPVTTAGSNTVLTIVCASETPLGHQWYFKGSPVPGATNATLIISNTQPANAGGYFAIISNASGSVTSQVATLKVETAFTKVASGAIATDAEQSEGVASADFDGDGLQDIFVANYNTQNGLYRNLGNGSFAKLTSGIVVNESGDPHSYSGAWGDYDNDGRVDLLVANFSAQTSLYRNLGNGDFSKTTTGPIVSEPGNPNSTTASWGDYDNDGWLDLFVANGGSANFLYHNKGDGTFEKVLAGNVTSDGGSAFGSAWGDYDNDGRLDLFVATIGGGAVDLLYHNDANGSFTKILTGPVVTTGGDSRGCVWGDYDNDGYLDLFVANRTGPVNLLYHNERNGTFSRVMVGAIATDTAQSVGCAWSDYDNDGWLDLFVANDVGNNNYLYLNNGDGTFRRITSGVVVNDGGASRGAAWSDLNNDGFLDLLVANNGGASTNFLYLNQGNSNAWLQVALVGKTSNRSGIGVKIRVHAKLGGISRWQMREVSGGGFGQNSLVQNFGLGDATNIDVLRIEWSSGIVQTFSNVAPRQFLTIPEQTTFYFAVNGRGSVSYSPLKNDYFIGEPVVLTATPRNTNWTRFLRWSDGNTSNPRTITVGTSNVFTGIFTNFVALEELVFKEWEADFGGTSGDIFQSLASTSDGGYILGGYSVSGANGNKTSGNFGNSDYWVVKLDANGSKQWETNFGGTDHDYLISLASTSDGGYILGGYSRSGASGNKTSDIFGGYDYWVVKLNANGGKQWETNYGGTLSDQFTRVVPTSDGGYILGGSSASGISGNKTSGNFGGYDYWVLKLDSNGKKQWEANYGGTSDDYLNTVVATRDGGYVLGGISMSGANGNKTSGNFGGPDYWVVKLTASGSKQWETNYGGTGPDILNSLAQTTDGGYILGGQSASGVSGNKASDTFGNYDYWVTKLDANGSKEWEAVFGGTNPEYLTSLAATSDGSYVLGGSSDSGASGNKASGNFGGSDYWVVKVNANGSKVWEANYGGTNYESFTSLMQIRPDSYILGGYSVSGADGNKTSGNFGLNDYWIVKLASREAPIGTPVVLVNGLYSPSNEFVLYHTNQASVTFTSTWAGATLYYSLDGLEPDFVNEYTGAFTVSGDVVVRVVAYGVDRAEAEPVVIRFIPDYSLVAATPGGGGIVIDPLTPPTGYASNTVVTLTATNLPGWTFLGWTGDVVTNSTNIAVTMNTAKSLQAIFGTGLATNSQPANGGGILLQPPQALYPYGTQVRISATPAAGRYFNRWSLGGIFNSNSPITLLITNANTNVVAQFGSTTNRVLTVLINGQGDVLRSPQLQFYTNGSNVTLTALSAAGSVFVAWSGDASGTSTNLNVVMNTNKTITANFTVPPTVTITAPTNGTVFQVPDFAFNASAADADGSITKVVFFLNGNLAGTITNAPYSLIVSNVASGLYSLTAKATDNAGGTGTSAPVSITVSLPPPVITAFSPQSGPTGSLITVSGANFSRYPSSNAVYFGAVRAMGTAAETNSLTVTVPIAAAYAPVSVTRGGLTGWANRPFAVTFSSSRVIDSSSFRYDGVGSFTSIAPNPSKVAIGDLDGDGKIDLAMGTGAFISIAHSQGSPGGVSYDQQTRLGTNVVPHNFNSVAFADMDGDGKLDVIAGGLDGFVTVYRNISTNGNLSAGSFAPPVSLGVTGNFIGLAVADIDLDGRPDIVVGNYYSNNVLVFRNGSTPGTVAFASQVVCNIPVAYSLGGVALCDFNGDGKPELVLWDSNSSVVSIFENTSPTGTIQPGMWNSTSRVDFPVADGPTSVVIGDLDGDGKPDLAVSGYRTNMISVLRNTATAGVIDNGSFAPRVDFVRPSSAGYATHIAIGDLNGDGKPDLVTVAGRAVTSIYRNTSSLGTINAGSFAARVDINLVGPTGEGVAVGDFDGDGKSDIVTVAEGVLYFHLNQLGPENVPPAVIVTSPTNGATFTAPADITLIASTGDSDGLVTNVSFYAGTTLIGAVTNGLAGTNSFSLSWSNVPAGSYSLGVVVTDNGGLSATSAPVSITVNAGGNQSPLVSLIAPTNGAVFEVGEDVTLTARAADLDGSVARVEFFAATSTATNLVGVSSNGVMGQFSVVWSHAVPNTYALTARAFDSAGASNVSAAAFMTVLLFDGPPAFRFEQAAYSVGEGDGTVTLRVIRNFSGFATVNYATGDGSAAAGADYNAAAGQLQFQSGESVKTIPVTIREDFVVEGSHTFNVTLSLPSSGALAGPSVATVTILDNDVQTGSSFLSIVPPSAVNTNDLGSLRVYLTGDERLGQWRLPWERSFRPSGTPAGGLQPGLYEIEFKPVSGYLVPSPLTVAVNAGQESRSTNAYTFLVSTPAGSLTVFLDPAEVGTNANPGCRGQWSVNGGPFNNSGATVAGLPAGGYTVSFKGLDAGCGWSTPQSREATVRPGASNSFRVSYVTNVSGPSIPAALNFANDIQNSYANQQPFTFVGQVTTEFGEGSGVVVKERVVLTAAHVVFDDYSLSWVGNAKWFFQRHAPDYSPAPQEVRGYYINGGYAAQRQVEGTPGASLPASFDLDVAALYFYEAAGRGGYGGYLVSETPSPQWLQTNALKALVGYPVEGIAPANLGKMHSVGPTSMSFDQNTTTGSVFTCSTIRGLPGNSGGPLCVKFGGNNYYYPAGIYVGGSDRAIVRAIDSRAVELINLAELTSNLGTNQSGGVIRFGVILPPGTCYQAAYVLIQPAAARLAGAQWQVHYKLGSPALSPWTSSSTTAILLNNKPDYLDLAPAEGFLTPDTTDYTLGCVTTNLVFTYVQVLPRLDPLAADGRHLVLSGITNRTYRVEYNGRIGTTNGWLTLTNITFTANNNIAVISNALHNLPTNRFYRTIRVP